MSDKQNHEDTVDKNEKAAQNQWTIMVYMSGDSNLTLEMASAVAQIKSVTDRETDLNLYVYYDGSSINVPTLYCDFTNSQTNNFYRADQVEQKLFWADDGFDENSAKIENVMNFVNWCVQRVPEERRDTQRYAFIFSGHSAGFLNWGLFRDERANYTMTHAKLRYMFERLTDDGVKLEEKAVEAEKSRAAEKKKPWSQKYRKQRTTPIIGKKLDLIGFDSCVMSTLEIASQFKDTALTMVASEGYIPKAGWNYADILLQSLAAGAARDPKLIAITFVEQFIKQQNKYAIADVSVDMAAWNLEALPAVHEKFEEMMTALTTCLDERSIAGFQRMRRVLTNAHQRCQTYFFEQHVDLGDFCERLIEEIALLGTEITREEFGPFTALSQKCVALRAQIAQCILLTGFSGTDYQFSTGISLYFPWSWGSLVSAWHDYQSLWFIRDCAAGKAWSEFLRVYLGRSTFRWSNLLTLATADGKLPASVVYESYSEADGSGQDLWIPGQGFQQLKEKELLSPTDKRSYPDAPRSYPDGPRSYPDGPRSYPDGPRSYPDGPRSYPDGPRSYPDGPRGIGIIEGFLSRFKALKNFEPNWNRSGFTSTFVTFERPGKSPGNSGLAKPDGKHVLFIPHPAAIQKSLNTILAEFNLMEMSKDRTDAIKAYADIFKNVVTHLDETALLNLLHGPEGKSFIDSAGRVNSLIEKAAKFVEASINEVKDGELKNAFTADFRRVRENF